MVNDQEPRYRLVDSNGNVVGSLFQNADGNVEIQDETGTGSVFGPDGIVTPAIDAESVSAEERNTEKSVVIPTIVDTVHVTPPETTSKIEWDDVKFEQLDGWDQENNHYKAPEDMTLMMSAIITLKETVDGQFLVRPSVNGSMSTLRGMRFENGREKNESIAFSTTAFELDEGDEFDLRIQNLTETEDVELDDGRNSMTLWRQ